jgi:predicted nucleotide-binding protein
MLGCKYGVSVFEEIDERDLNPNVAIELGFMFGLGKRCLILKDQRMPKMPADIIGKLYKQFDTYDMEATIASAVVSWFNDLGFQKPS